MLLVALFLSYLRIEATFTATIHHELIPLLPNPPTMLFRLIKVAQKSLGCAAPAHIACIYSTCDRRQLCSFTYKSQPLRRFPPELSRPFVRALHKGNFCETYQHPSMLCHNLKRTTSMSFGTMAALSLAVGAATEANSSDGGDATLSSLSLALPPQAQVVDIASFVSLPSVPTTTEYNGTTVRLPSRARVLPC